MEAQGGHTPAGSVARGFRGAAQCTERDPRATHHHIEEGAVSGAATHKKRRALPVQGGSYTHVGRPTMVHGSK